MYAFAMALYGAGLHDIDLYPHMMAQVRALGRSFTLVLLAPSLLCTFMPHNMRRPPPPSQPPYDADYELVPGRPFYILHYTYGLDFDQKTGRCVVLVYT